MSRKQRTNAFLQLADENREFAHELIFLQPCPLRWVSVVAFYSAVHYVGAHLWERYDVKVTSHPEREKEIFTDVDLKAKAASYRRLFDASLTARYEARFGYTQSEVHKLLNVDLLTIAHCVYRNLPPK